MVRSRLFSFAAALFSRAFQPNTRRTRFYSRVVCACLLVVHLVASLGLVLPHWASKEVKERFPCEDCPCGCPTAQFCWDQCCCHTDEEKLAWAHENGIESPIFLLDRVALKTRSTIQKPVVRACCAGKSKTGAVAATCDSITTDSQPNREVHTVAKADHSYSLVLIDAALRCHGMDLAFLLLT